MTRQYLKAKRKNLTANTCFIELYNLAVINDIEKSWMSNDKYLKFIFLPHIRVKCYFY